MRTSNVKPNVRSIALVSRSQTGDAQRLCHVVVVSERENSEVNVDPPGCLCLFPNLIIRR